MWIAVQREGTRKPLLCSLVALLALATPAVAQKAAPAPAPPPANAASPEFFRAADEVLQEMSQLLSLPVKEPLKKSIRSRDEIRAYIIREMNEDKEPAKRYADQKTLEKLGLIPPGFDLDRFLIDLLTEQIAGLYDPKAREFYIADWIDVSEQKIVMAHELTHALDDQYFHIDDWVKAARPNDDAELARGAVVEGSALAAMLDYSLHGMGRSVRDLPDIADLVGVAVGDLDRSPQLAKAPMVVRDSLLFPYLSGASFTQRILRASSGWADFKKVFESPPASTQQVLHPELYLKGAKPQPVTLPEIAPVSPPGWKKLDENILGEFGLEEVLKQFLGADRAAKLAPAWAGDRYALFENQANRRLLLVLRLRLASGEDAAHFFGNYSEALELKYPERKELFRQPNFFQFSTGQGDVFLRCFGNECLVVEGIGRNVFEGINRALGWPAAPVRPRRLREKPVSVAALAAD